MEENDENRQLSSSAGDFETTTEAATTRTIEDGRLTCMEVENDERNDWKTSIAGVAGNVLEWYDFAVFGFFSDVIGDNFFPKDEESPNSALVKSFVVFATAFLARPFGGAIIGMMGDSVGRKTAVEVSIFLMAFPTFALGCIPTYQQLGGFATFLLILLRLLQGVSVGGQLMSSVVFTIERKDVSQWGIWGSSVYAFSSVGVVIGSLFSYILRTSLTDEELHDWGWRIPFFFSIFGLLPACYLKHHVQDHPNDTTKQQQQQGTLKMTFRQDNRKALLCSIFVISISASSYYLIAIWLPMYMESVREPPIPHSFAIATVVGLVSIPLTFLGGWIADRVSPSNWKYLLIVSNVILGTFCPVIFAEISSNKENIGVIALFWMLFLTSAMNLFNGALIPFLVSLFPVDVRLTSLAVSYNLALCLFGGFTPSLATVLADKNNKDATSAGYIVTVLALCSIIGLFLAPKNQYTKPTTATIETTETTTPNDLEIPEIS